MRRQLSTMSAMVPLAFLVTTFLVVCVEGSESDTEAESIDLPMHSDHATAFVANMKLAAANGFRAFSVEDDLSLSPSGKKRRSRIPSTSRPSAAKIDLTVPKGAVAADVWQKYFASSQPAAEAVREAVRRLWTKKRYAQVIDFINAALRNGQTQPWMYEVISLAMQMQGASNDEIERVVMSAVDFADTPADLLYIGVHVNRLGLHRRALEIFKQTSELVPLRPEPYMFGLQTADELDDVEARKWATVGILSQAWTKDQQHVWKTGLRVAGATLERLRREQRFEEAKQYQAEVDSAVMRDCLVRVSWSGAADVDLLVEEPSGAVCSLRNRRTTSGGVMLGDNYARASQDSDEGYCETYVCPEGFSGTYRLLLRRVWGKVVAGKVNVDVYTNYRGKDSRHLRKRISFIDDQAVVVFDLDKGRRKQSLADQQVANAAANHVAIGRQILAQQLNGVVDPGAMQDFSLSQAGNSGKGGGFSPMPFRRSGAVGYQPVITVLPEGANMSATAVVSADRRYVRVTSSPLFSGIAEVNVFNMASGVSTEGGGGTGGEGWSGVSGQ